MSEKLRIGILGASGYTGADLVRLLARTPGVEIAALTANNQAGKALEEVFPHLGFLDLPRLTRWEEVAWDSFDAAFCALPHGTTQEIVRKLPEKLKVIDLSADFRLRDPELYAVTYKKPHAALALQEEAVYGLTEWARPAIAAARLVACPGCYPTAVLLALLPLVEKGLIDCEDIIVDAKSGVSGAGRKPQESLLFSEVAESLSPYSVGKHRHAPEIEQELAQRAGKALTITFTPHLVPMNRGELVTCYLRLSHGGTPADLRTALATRYKGEAFVKLLPDGVAPSTRQVRGSNDCAISVFADRVPGRAIVIAALDNLVKGSAGQALQNFNLMFGRDEGQGLAQLALAP